MIGLEGEGGAERPTRGVAAKRRKGLARAAAAPGTPPVRAIDPPPQVPAEVEARPAPEGVPRELGPARIRSAILTGIFLIALLWLLSFAKPVIVPTVLATVLAIVLTPAVRAAGRLGVPASIAALLVIGGVLGTTVMGVWLLSGPAIEWAERMPALVENIERKTSGLRSSVEEVEQISDQVGELVAGTGGAAPGTLEVTVREARPLARLFMLEMGNVVVGAALVFALAFFLLASGDGFLRKLVHVIPELRGKVQAVTILRGIQREISLYFATITTINIGLGVVTGAAMWLMGLPNAVLWGTMAALLNFVPYLGAIAGVAVIGLIGSAEFDTLGPILWTMGVYYALTAAESNIVTPLLLGRRMTLNPPMIFLSVLLWGWLWGLTGVFLAVPILAAMKIVCDRVPALGAVGEFLGK